MRAGELYPLTADGQTFDAYFEEHDGQSWLLIGRGREGWEFDADGQGTADDVSQDLRTPNAFSPACYSNAIVNDLLSQAGWNMANVTMRLSRASAPDGAGAYQDVRWRDFTGNGNAFTWRFDSSQYGVTVERVNAPAGLAGAQTGTNTGGNTRDYSGGGNDADRVFTWAWNGHVNKKGFSYGSSVANGANTATSFLWENADEQHAIPYTEVYIVYEAPVAGRITWLNRGVSNITATSAQAYATVNTNLSDLVLVWDASDRGTSNTTDWAYSRELGVATAGVVTAEATNLLADTLYTWRFYGVSATTNGWSQPGTFAAALTAAQTPVFTGAVAMGWSAIELGWRDNASNETDYVLQRSTNGVDFSLLATLPADSTSYTDAGLLQAGTYTYRLAATNAANGSGTDFAACETNATVSGAPGGMIFYDSFEDPDITGQGPNNTFAPPGWVSPGGGYYGLEDEDNDRFTTPYGSQAAWIFDNVGTPGTIGERNQSLTTTEVALNEPLRLGYTYTVTFNAASTSAGQPQAYRVRLMAIDAGGAATELAQVIGPQINTTDMSETNGVVFTPDGSHSALLGQRIAIQLRKDKGDWHNNILYDNVMLVAEPPPAGQILWGFMGASNITAASAWPHAMVNTNLNALVLVWDTSDQGTSNTVDWTYSQSLGSATGGVVTGEATNLLADTEYTWRFYGTNSYPTNSWSPAAVFPTALTAAQTPAFTNAVASLNAVALTWTDNAATETAYVLQRSDAGSGGPYSVVATLGGDVTTHMDVGLSPSTTYTYRLAASNAVNGSATDFAACQTNATTSAFDPESRWLTPEHVVSGSVDGALVAIDVPYLGAGGVTGGPVWTADSTWGGSAHVTDNGFATVNDRVENVDGTSNWEPDGTPIAEARGYFTYGNGPVPSVKYTFNLESAWVDIPDASVINAVYATWNTRNRDGITYQYTEGAATDSIVRQSDGTAPVADLVLRWTDSASTPHDGNFERIFTGPITVGGGDGFELWATDNIGNAAHIDAVVIDVSLPSRGLLILVR